MARQFLKVSEDLDESGELLLKRKVYIVTMALLLTVLPLSYIPLIVNGEFGYLAVNLCTYTIYLFSIIKVRKVLNPVWYYRSTLFVGIVITLVYAVLGSLQGNVQSTSILW